jgi:hypothetical protein
MLIAVSAVCLLICEGALRLFGFRTLHAILSGWPTMGSCAPDRIESRVAAIIRAVDKVSPMVALRAYCLSKSAAAVCVMRLYGIGARVSIGVRQFPFAAHAWINVNGVAIKDPLDISEGYAILDQM